MFRICQQLKIVFTIHCVYLHKMFSTLCFAAQLIFRVTNIQNSL